MNKVGNFLPTKPGNKVIFPECVKFMYSHFNIHFILEKTLALCFWARRQGKGRGM